MTELRGLQLSLPEIRARGIDVVAVSPDSVERNRGVVRRFDLGYRILSDAELAATGALGLEHAGGGPDGATIPRPATFFVRDGTILWRELTDNYRVRPKPDEVLAALGERGLIGR